MGWVGLVYNMLWVGLGFKKLTRVLPGLTRIWNTQVAGIDEASQ